MNLPSQFLPVIPVWLLFPLAVFAILPVLVLMVSEKHQRLAWARRAMIGMLMLVVALRPVAVSNSLESERLNADVYFVVDMTGSMAAEDEGDGRTRFDTAKAEIQAIMKLLPGARFSVITFDSASYLELPLTTDTTALRAWLDTAKLGATATSRGSNMAVGLKKAALTILDDRQATAGDKRYLFFISDGENTDDQETEFSSGFKSLLAGGAVIGVGTPEGGPMKKQGVNADGSYITAKDGSRAISKANPQQLQLIARKLSIAFVPDGQNANWAQILKVKELEKVPREGLANRPKYQEWYLLPALLLVPLVLWELGHLTRSFPSRRRLQLFIKDGS